MVLIWTFNLFYLLEVLFIYAGQACKEKSNEKNLAGIFFINSIHNPHFEYATWLNQTSYLNHSSLFLGCHMNPSLFSLLIPKVMITPSNHKDVECVYFSDFV